MAYGIVTEQGDLGLGFNEMTKDEEEKVKESAETNNGYFTENEENN